VQKPRHAPYICAVPLMQILEYGIEIRLPELKKNIILKYALFFNDNY
jgi:hypothetical protein